MSVGKWLEIILGDGFVELHIFFFGDVLLKKKNMNENDFTQMRNENV